MFVSELSVLQCENLYLFDDLEYKYIKHFIDDKKYNIKLQIKELPCVFNGFRKLHFTMMLPCNHKISTNITYKEVCVIKQFDFGSAYHVKTRHLFI